MMEALPKWFKAYPLSAPRFSRSACRAHLRHVPPPHYHPQRANVALHCMSTLRAVAWYILAFTSEKLGPITASPHFEGLS